MEALAEELKNGRTLTAQDVSKVIRHKRNPKFYTLEDNLPAVDRPAKKDFVFATPTEDIGDLCDLPLEIVYLIICETDMTTLESFRLVNRRCNELIQSVPQWVAIHKHALSAVRGMRAIQAGYTNTLQWTYDKLCQAECDECDNFAPYLFLLSGARACFPCLTENSRFLPLCPCSAVRKFGLSEEQLNTVPFMKSIPGKYSVQRISNHRLTLLDPNSAYFAAIEEHGSKEAMEKYLRRLHTRQMADYLAADPATRKLPRSPSDDSPDRGDTNILRFMAAVMTPVLNKRTGELDSGFYCLECRGCRGCRHHHKTRPFHWQTRYTMDTFIKHIRRHGKRAELRKLEKERKAREERLQLAEAEFPPAVEDVSQEAEDVSQEAEDVSPEERQMLLDDIQHHQPPPATD